MRFGDDLGERERPSYREPRRRQTVWHPNTLRFGSGAEAGGRRVGLVGGIGSLIREHLREFSIFCKFRSEILRPILGLLDPVKRLRMCF